VPPTPIITANWLAASSNRWTLPIGGGVAKIVKFGKLPVNFQLQAFDNVVTPKQGGADWQLRFQVSMEPVVAINEAQDKASPKT
jgi:hypothetical protein